MTHGLCKKAYMGMVEALHCICLFDKAAHLVNHDRAFRRVTGQVGVVYTIYKDMKEYFVSEDVERVRSSKTQTRRALHTRECLPSPPRLSCASRRSASPAISPHFLTATTTPPCRPRIETVLALMTVPKLPKNEDVRRAVRGKNEVRRSAIYINIV
jgi:hypothetical protein